MRKRYDFSQGVRGKYAGRVKTPGNANMAAVASAAALYGVPYYRMQSRTFTVEGAGGRDRPMFMGGWNDRTGIFHAKGMADFLLTPRITITGAFIGTTSKVCVPLWCECKAGKDELSAEQEAFRDDVQAAGAFWICCHNSCDELLAFFKQHGVTR
jgi:hypothetical protein